MMVLLAFASAEDTKGQVGRVSTSPRGLGFGYQPSSSSGTESSRAGKETNPPQGRSVLTKTLGRSLSSEDPTTPFHLSAEDSPFTTAYQSILGSSSSHVSFSSFFLPPGWGSGSTPFGTFRVVFETAPYGLNF
jgi:hypothetical protein